MHGVLLIDKPRDLTSANVVSRVKRLTRSKKVGHCGTLDPLASGLLVICLNEATKISRYLLSDDKGYLATFEVGVETDTLDSTGQVIATTPIPALSTEQIDSVLATFRGEIEQVPPMYSALKRGGKRLYQYAREGITVDRDPRTVTINRLELRSWNPPHAELVISCSKGTYVRSLIRDIGQALGCGATMTALRRTHSGHFQLEDAISLDALGDDGDLVANALVSIDQALRAFPRVALDDHDLARVRNGRTVRPAAPILELGQHVLLCGPDGVLVAIAHAVAGTENQMELQVTRGFNL